MTRFCAVHATWPAAMLLLATMALLPKNLWAITPEQRREATALYLQIKEAGTLYSQDKFQESAELVETVQTRVQEMAKGADPELLRALQQIHNRVIRAHALLELEGVELPPIVDLVPDKPGPGTSPPGAGVSFASQVAPLLVSKCGNCHVNNARGDFSMATYVNLMRGSSAGRVVFPGDASGSRLIEVIESGDMPRGGGKLSGEQLQLLKDWIGQGAKFDGPNAGVSLTSFASTAGGEPMAAPSVTAATGDETVSFARDIAPVLAENCNGCHVNAQQTRGGLNMSTFATLLTGGDSGPVVAPKNPAGSLMLTRIKGEGGDPRMPQGRPPLSDEVIGKIETWIAEGATFDGPDPRQNVVRVAALAKAEAATHAELSDERRALAERNWRLGMPGIPASYAETTNFLLVGSAGPETLEEYGQLAERLAPRVGAMLDAPPNQPLLKGRMTLYFFKQRYDYSEFGQMVEKRELPKDWRGHWRFDVVDAYGAMISPRENEYSLEGLISEQLGAAYVASLGDVPEWFADGSGRVIAGRLASRDPRIIDWKNSLAPALALMSKPDDLMQNKLPPDAAAVVGYSFLDFLMKNNKSYLAVLDGLRNGMSFDQAFASAYGATPAQASEIWVRTAARRR